LANTITDKYVNALVDRQNELATGIVANPVPDYAMYRQICGEWAGLQSALTILNELIKGERDGEI